jgi:hypothetical protein
VAFGVISTSISANGMHMNTASAEQALSKSLIAAEKQFNASGGPAKLQALFAANPSLSSELTTQVSRATGLKLKSEYFDITPVRGFNRAYYYLARIGRQGIYWNLPQRDVDNSYWEALTYFATLLVGTCMTTPSCVNYDTANGLLYGVSTSSNDATELRPANVLSDLIVTYLKLLLDFVSMCMTGKPYYANEDGTISKDPISDLARLFACLIAAVLGAPIILFLIWLVKNFPPPMNPPFTATAPLIVTPDLRETWDITGRYGSMWQQGAPYWYDCIAGTSAFTLYMAC